MSQISERTDGRRGTASRQNGNNDRSSKAQGTNRDPIWLDHGVL